jgi:hypothetical protein
MALEALLFDTSFIGLYPEFRGRSTFSIAWEVEYREKSLRSSRSRELLAVLAELGSLESRLKNTSSTAEQDEIIQAVKERVMRLNMM